MKNERDSLSYLMGGIGRFIFLGMALLMGCGRANLPTITPTWQITTSSLSVTPAPLTTTPTVRYTTTKEVRFDHISLEQGLSPSVILDMLQDSQSFMWFATQDGLIEAENVVQELFGRQGLLACAKTRVGHTAVQIKDGIINDVQQFTGEVHLLDDLVLLVGSRELGNDTMLCPDEAECG